MEYWPCLPVAVMYTGYFGAGGTACMEITKMSRNLSDENVIPDQPYMQTNILLFSSIFKLWKRKLWVRWE